MGKETRENQLLINHSREPAEGCSQNYTFTLKNNASHALSSRQERPKGETGQKSRTCHLVYLKQSSHFNIVRFYSCKGRLGLAKGPFTRRGIGLGFRGEPWSSEWAWLFSGTNGDGSLWPRFLHCCPQLDIAKLCILGGVPHPEKFSKPILVPGLEPRSPQGGELVYRQLTVAVAIPMT